MEGDNTDKLTQEITRLRAAIKKAADDIYQWNYGVKCKNILDIHADLVKAISNNQTDIEGTGENGF